MTTGSHRVLLDTNVAIGLLAGERGVVKGIEQCEAVALCHIVLGELLYGAMRSARVAHNLDRVEALAAMCTVLGTDDEVARWYGELKNELRTRGAPIPSNDLWVAAIARRHSLSVATRDRHFDAIPGLEIVRW